MGDKAHLRKLAKYLDKFIGVHDSETGNYGDTNSMKLLEREGVVRSLIEEKFGLFHMLTNYEEKSSTLSAFVNTKDLLGNFDPTEREYMEYKKSVLKKIENLEQNILAMDYTWMSKFHEEKRTNIEKLLK